MSEPQKPQTNAPSTHASGAGRPSTTPAAQGGQPGQAAEAEMSDAAHSMETVTVDPRTLDMLRGGGQPQAPGQASSPSPQPASGQVPAAGPGAVDRKSVV